MFAAMNHRSVTRRVTKQVSQVESNAVAPGNAACKYVQITSSVPCLVRADAEKIEDAKVLALSDSDDGVLYIPADTPVVLIGARRFLSIRSLGPDGYFCVCPMGTM